jgi:hypothetical protein
MAAWIEVKNEIVNRNYDYDGVRREKIKAVEIITNRPLVIYSTAFLEGPKVEASRGEVQIDRMDSIGFNEVINRITGKELDVLIHSPGGSPEAAEAIVDLLRSKFDHIRFIVPHMAKSAATMICCSGNEILMDEKSELGPIDPQMQLLRSDGKITVAPAQAIIKQFDKAKLSLANNPKEMTAWLPILQPLGPSLLTECEIANQLSKLLVTKWLINYMFSGMENINELAEKIADFLANNDIHMSHGRRINIDQVKEIGMVVSDLRDNEPLRIAVWNLYHAISWTLQETPAFKIIENGQGDAFIRQVFVSQIPIPPQIPRINPPSKQPTQAQNSRKSRKRH